MNENRVTMFLQRIIMNSSIRLNWYFQYWVFGLIKDGDDDDKKTGAY